jgi:hypothetical protein
MRLFLTVAVSCAVCGCHSDSTDVLTSGMSADLGVVATGSGSTNAGATIYQGIPERLIFVELRGDDSLVASTGSQSKTLDESNLLGIISYSAQFDGADAEGTPYQIAFHRKLDSGAPASTCTLPAAFSISAPAAGGTFSRAGSDIAVTYSPGGKPEEMVYELGNGSDCLQPVSQRLSGDPGSFTIAKGTLQPKDAAHANASCQVTLAISRLRPGMLDPGFGKGGTMNCIQTRSVVFQSSP